jgi:RimJ/RimL family protein N-acetyltransferase
VAGESSLGHILVAMEARPATLDDCAAIARGMKVVVDEGLWLATEPSVGEDDLEQRFRFSVESDEHHSFVLTEDGEVIGALGLNPTQAPGVLALGMWLMPEWRGRGGGRMLVEAAIAARPAEAHKIELEVFVDNEPAIALYRSIGFEQEGVRRDHYRREDGSLRSALVMARLF